MIGFTVFCCAAAAAAAAGVGVNWVAEEGSQVADR
jgi:hypothetical protein